jgi:hypothetical protein
LHFHVFSLTTKQENFLIRRVYKQKLLIYLLDALEIFSSQKIIPLKRLSTRNTYKRQATQHGCLPVPSLLGDGDKDIEIVYGEEKNYFVLGRPEHAAKAEQKSLVPARQA